jgi:hypothetical protein
LPSSIPPIFLFPVRSGRDRADEPFRAAAAMFGKYGKFLKRVEVDEEVKTDEKKA